MSEYAAAELAREDAAPGAHHNPDTTSFLKEDARTAAAKDITFGSLAGMVGKVVEYPFDTIKVRLQSQPSTGPLRYSGPLDCFQQSWRAGGVRSLYRGISAPMFGAAVETSSLFFSYRLAQKAVHRMIDPSSDEQSSSGRLPLSALLVCGGASGAFTSALLTPIELVKCQMQVPTAAATSAGRTAGTAGVAAPPNPFTIVAAIYRHQGLRGFWRGQLGTLIRETGGSAAWFGSYEGVCAAFRRASSPPAEKLSVGHQLLAGASAGMAYNFICYPADTVKSRMQTEDVGGTQRRETFGRVARQLWREHGLRGMYRGCGITVARAAPSSAVIFAVYETLLGWWT